MHGHWFTEGTQTNPGAGAVIADTDELSAGDYLVAVSLTSDADAAYDVQLRNNANNATLRSQRRRVKAAVGNDDFVVATRVQFGERERLRVVTPSAITGEVQASIFLQRVVG